MFNREYKENEYTVFKKFKLNELKLLFEYDAETIKLFKRTMREINKQCFLELSYVSHDLIVYGDFRLNRLHLLRSISDFLNKHRRDQHIDLRLGSVAIDNNVIFKKLIEKLNNFRYSLEYEWRMKIPARFEMLKYGSIRIVLDQNATSLLMNALMDEHQTDAPINFQTMCLVNTNFVSKLVKESKGKCWKIHVNRGAVVFTGPYVYYLFFNILFEEYLFAGSYVLPECVYSMARFAEYAKVFQRSRKLLNEFKESLSDDLRDCRCEMRAFVDELIVEPSLELVKKPTSSNLKERYNEAFENFVEQRLTKREIRIIYGQILNNDADYNFLKHFTTVLNAEIRLMERVTFEPLLVIAQEKLNTTDNIVLVGLTEDVNFVANKLVQPVEKFQRVKVNNSRKEHIESVFSLFHEFYKNKHETRFIDFLFFRTYFDIRDNGLYQRIDLEMQPSALREQEFRKAVLDSKGVATLNNTLFALNYGKCFIECSFKANSTVKENEEYFRPLIAKLVDFPEYEINFGTLIFYKNEFQRLFFKLLAAESVVINEEKKNLVVEIKSCFKEQCSPF